MQIAGIQAIGLGFHIHKQHIGQTRGAQRSANSTGVDAGTLRCGKRQQGAPVAVLLDEQRIHRHGHRGLFKIGRLQQGLAARGCDIGKKRRKQLRAHRQALNRLRQPRFQLGGGGQAGLAGALRRCAGKITAGTFKSGEFALIDLRLQYRGNLFGRLQYGFPARAGYHHQITHIRRAHVGAQTGIQVPHRLAIPDLMRISCHSTNWRGAGRGWRRPPAAVSRPPSAVQRRAVPDGTGRRPIADTS